MLARVEGKVGINCLLLLSCIIEADATGWMLCTAIRREGMRTRQPRYSAEETARRGDAIYERDIRAQVEPTHRGKVVAIDIESGAHVVADNALTASERLLAQHP